MFEIALGATVEDKITGFRGVVMRRAEYLNGCIKYAVQSTELHDGKPLGWEWFDAQEIRVVEPAKELERKPAGGPQALPPQA